MKITKTTLTWYRQKTKPFWAKEIIEHERLISIDEVINSQTGYGKNIDKHYVSHNLMSLCKSYIRRGVLLEMLRELQYNPGTLIEPQKRAAYAKKWADRIEKNNKEKERTMEIEAHIQYNHWNGLYVSTLLGGEFANCHGQGPTPELAMISLRLTVRALRNVGLK